MSFDSVGNAERLIAPLERKSAGLEGKYQIANGDGFGTIAFLGWRG